MVPVFYSIILQAIYVTLCYSYELSVSIDPYDGMDEPKIIGLLESNVKQLIFEYHNLRGGSAFHYGDWRYFIEDTTKIAAKYQARTMMSINFPRLESRDKEPDAFKALVQLYIAHYGFDGILFRLEHEYDSVDEQVEFLNPLLTATSSIKTNKGYPALAAISLPARNLSTSTRLWDSLLKHKPWRYADQVHVHLGGKGVAVDKEYTSEWTQAFVSQLISAPYWIYPGKLSVVVDTEGTNGRNYYYPYSRLVNRGAPINGDGYFSDGFVRHVFYTTQKQVLEKVLIAIKHDLYGLTFITPSSDLPLSNTSSLLSAAVVQW